MPKVTTKLVSGKRIDTLVRTVRNSSNREEHRLGGLNLPVLEHRTGKKIHQYAGHLWFQGNVLYRFYDPDGQLLYVGITSDFYRRCYEHSSKSWWKGVEFATIDIDATSRPGLIIEESKTIPLERPIYNIDLNPSGWGQDLLPFGTPNPELQSQAPLVYALITELQAIKRIKNAP